jgi:hypothetical protein
MMPQPTKPPSIPPKIERLIDLTKVISAQVAALDARLAPYSSNPIGKDMGTNVTPNSTCKVDEELNKAIDGFEMIQYRLMSMLESLEL